MNKKDFLANLLEAEKQKEKIGISTFGLQLFADEMIHTFNGHSPTIRAHVKNLVDGNPSAFMKLVKARKAKKGEQNE